ncbi:hypothetical protein DFH09DRAFT_1037820 [Mycena vulgaris]|nr:hypothetical protein DFH09DRAFT_1037820 [Mycena vulgaris]
MSDRLPDELISEILSPALKVPEDMFSDTSQVSPFASSAAGSSSSTLLVCKSWQRVATPFLYSFIVIRSKAQAWALQATLKSTPELGRFVKQRSIEGGFGNLMRDILLNTPNITDIFLSLHIHASDSSSALALGLPLINPTRLIIFDDSLYPLKNKAVVELMTRLQICVPKWNNLSTVQLPYNQRITGRESFCSAICSTSTISTVSFPRFKPCLLPFLVKLAQIPCLKAIEIQADNITPPLQSTDSRLNALLRWVDPSANCPAPAYNAPIRLPTDPSFRPMESTPQPSVDRIWSRILFFAMLSLEEHPENTQPWQLAKQKVNSRRLQFLLVSKLFQRLARPYLYYYPVLVDKFPSFSRTLDMQPTLGRHIRELDIRKSVKGLSYYEFLYTSLSIGTALSLASILPHTCHLTRLVGDFSSIPWRTFTTLAKIAGSTITGFACVTITEDIGATLEFALPTHSLMFSSSFSAMRTFTWKYETHLFTFRSRDDSLFDPLDEAAVVALPALEFLSMKSPEALSLFSEMRLPSLRRASFELLGHWDTTLLKAHGAKLQHLQVERATIAKQSLLALCPNIATLTCRVYARDNYVGLSPTISF